MDYKHFGIHIALSKYPLGETEPYIAGLLKLYGDYRENIVQYLGLNENCKAQSVQEYMQHLYAPRILHMFSHYDVGFISIVDNYKFNQRIFEPHFENNENVKSVSYQILSGQILQWSGDSDWLFNPSPSFIKIIQLKLNNGLLIGNGIALQNEAVCQITNVLKLFEISDYIIVKCFNWSELIIIAQHKDPNLLANALIRIRKSSLNHLEPKKASTLIENSLYSTACWNVSNPENSHVFSDTMSYLGVDREQIMSVVPETELKTMVEWQIKPGHLQNFIDAGRMTDGTNTKVLPLMFNGYEKIYFKNGKTDYFIEEDEPMLFKGNQTIYEAIRDKPEINCHIRKVKTKALYNLDLRNIEFLKNLEKEKKEGPVNSEKCLEQYKIKNAKDVSAFLRKLNVSRISRKKVSKLLYNYNLGIQDPVLCAYFIDLRNLITLFIEELEKLSEEVGNAITKGKLTNNPSKALFTSLKSNYIEAELLQRYISVLEEAFEDRILNNYNYEDINEFSLEINSSLTSIVSSLDTLVKVMGTCFRDNNGNAILTTINDKATISNRLAVNYNVEHLTNLPLIFATLIKEILNNEDTKFVANNATLIKQIKEDAEKKFSESPEIDQILQHEFMSVFDINAYIIDYKKYTLTFLKNRELFIFWHWNYPLQSTHLYSSIGHFDELNFLRELVRLIMVLQDLGSPADIRSMKCPIPELRSFWDKYFRRVKKMVETMQALDSFKKFNTQLEEQLAQSINRLYRSYETKAEEKKDKNILEKLTNNINKGMGGLIEDIEDQKTNPININDVSDKLKDRIKAAKITASRHGIKPHELRMAFFKLISFFSYYNLNYIADKFDYEVKLLRRDYNSGLPVNHFLNTHDKWFIDPFGGYFINDIEDRKEYLLLTNTMLELIWDLSMYLKKDLFVKKENFFV